MKKILLAAGLVIYSTVSFGGGSIGGGGGSSKASTELASSAFSLDHLPVIHVDPETLRRAEARLSVEGVESLQIPVDSGSVAVRKLNSLIVDTEITRKFMPQ